MAYICQKSFDQYPDLKRFLETNPNNEGMDEVLNNIIKVRYSITFVSAYWVRNFSLNVIGVCTFLGKLEHIKFIDRKDTERRINRLRENRAAEYLSLLNPPPELDSMPIALREDLCPSVPEMIKANDYVLFRFAAINGHVSVMTYLASRVDNVQAMIKAKNYIAYRYGASNNNIDVLYFMERTAPDKVRMMIQANNYIAYRAAAIKGHMVVVLHLEKMAPNDVLAMIRAENYQAYRYAARDGLSDVLYHLEVTAPNDVEAMIQAEQYYAFRIAVKNGHKNVVMHLLNFPQCFAYAESHFQEYDERYLYYFIEEVRIDLLQRKRSAELENPHARFDVVQQVAEICFYILRHYIRRNDEKFLPGIDELLLLPSVRALIPQSVKQGEPFELLHMAIFAGNQAAVCTLLNIPEVREFAEENNWLENQNHVQEYFDDCSPSRDDIILRELLDEPVRPKKRLKLSIQPVDEFHHRFFPSPVRNHMIHHVLDEYEEHKEQAESPTHKKSISGECIEL